MLIKAVREGDTETAIALINFGVNDDKKDRKLRTALMWAAEKGHTEIAKLLIDARYRFRDDYYKKYKRPYLADEDKTGGYLTGWTALTLAAREGHTEIVNALINTGFDFCYWEIDTRSKDKTALEWAAVNGHTEIVKTLIGAGADINDNRHGYQWKNALMYAAENGHTEIVNILIDAGANVEVHRDGWTALIYATIGGHTEIVKALIDAGANINAKTNGGQTPLSFAIQNGHAEVINALLDAGLKLKGRDYDFNADIALDKAREKGTLEGTDALKRLDEIFPYKPSASPATAGGCMTIIIEAFAIITALVAVGCLL